jgi:hypothetical protein
MKSPVQIAVRLPSSVIDALDRTAARMSKDGLEITRTALIRMLIVQGLRPSQADKTARSKS